MALFFALEKAPLNSEVLEYFELVDDELATRNNRDAFTRIGKRLLSVDKVKSADFFEKAAYLGDKEGAMRLAGAYGAGSGRVKNFILAAAWTNICSAQDVKVCRDLLKTVMNQLSIEDKREAHKISYQIENKIKEKRFEDEKDKIFCNRDYCSWN